MKELRITGAGVAMVPVDRKVVLGNITKVSRNGELQFVEVSGTHPTSPQINLHNFQIPITKLCPALQRRVENPNLKVEFVYSFCAGCSAGNVPKACSFHTPFKKWEAVYELKLLLEDDLASACTKSRQDRRLLS